MITDTLLTLAIQHWPSWLIVGLAIYLASNRFNRGLNKYPGPVLASFTDWWRFYDVYKRRAEVTHQKLHAKHGDVVRLGPNTISFADPKALKTIYGLNKGFVKVSYIVNWSLVGSILTHSSPRFIQFNNPFRMAMHSHLSLAPLPNHSMHNSDAQSMLRSVCPPWSSTNLSSPAPPKSSSLAPPISLLHQPATHHATSPNGYNSMHSM